MAGRNRDVSIPISPVPSTLWPPVPPSLWLFLIFEDSDHEGFDGTINEVFSRHRQSLNSVTVQIQQPPHVVVGRVVTGGPSWLREQSEIRAYNAMIARETEVMQQRLQQDTVTLFEVAEIPDILPSAQVPEVSLTSSDTVARPSSSTSTVTWIPDDTSDYDNFEIYDEEGDVVIDLSYSPPPSPPPSLDNSSILHDQLYMASEWDVNRSIV